MRPSRPYAPSRWRAPRRQAASPCTLESRSPTTGEVIGTRPDDHARRGAGGRRRRRADPARLGAADGRRTGPATCCAPPTRCSTRSTRSPSCWSASRASRGSRPTRWSCCRPSTRCTGCAKAGPKVLADEKVPMRQAFTLSKSGHFSYEPIGVVGVIAPWNYPWSIPFGEVAIALMAGNGVVLKPASLTPLLGEKIRAVFERGGLPEGLVRVVHGGGAVGEALARSSVAKVFFTGSVEVGRHVGEVCASAAQGQRARARRQGPDDRLRRRRPRQRGQRRGLGRLRQRRADLLGDRARLRDARGRRPLRRRRRRARPSGCRSATRSPGRPRSAR